MTRICIFGAGAIGGYVGARLALKGEADLSLVARGAHLAAMQARGLTLKQAGETHVLHPRVTSDPRELGPQDFIILALKAHAVSGVIEQMQPLIGKDTAILFAQNGIPWWYFHGIGGAHEGRTLESVDPGGAIWKRIGPERALGTVVWQAAEIEAPGVIAHHYGDRMPIGEPTGEKTERALTLSKLLTAAGVKSPVRPNLRNEIWLKLWGNLSFNPVSVLDQRNTDRPRHRFRHPPRAAQHDGGGANRRRGARGHILCGYRRAHGHGGEGRRAPHIHAAGCRCRPPDGTRCAAWRCDRARGTRRGSHAVLAIGL